MLVSPLEEGWQRLLQELNSWARATEAGPGRVRVFFTDAAGAARVVDIVMTPEQWEDMAGGVWGSFEGAARELRQAVLSASDNDRFLVFDTYELRPSPTETLPVDPDQERLDQLAREHPEGFGRWVVLDREGNVVDEFGRHQD